MAGRVLAYSFLFTLALFQDRHILGSVPISSYGRDYQRERAKLLQSRHVCELALVCKGLGIAVSADHQPPLSLHDHRPGSGCCVLIPACLDCQRVQGGQLRRGVRRFDRTPPRASREW